MKRYLFVLLAILLLGLVACGGSDVETPAAGDAGSDEGSETTGSSGEESAGFSTAALVADLQAAGATVTQSGEVVSQSFFAINGEIITVDGETVQVFEYPDAAAASADASQVAPDGGSVGNSIMSWIAPPHFYLKDRVLVLYVGLNLGVITTLDSVLGIQFAGQ